MDHTNILKLIRITSEQSELINLIETLLENNFKEKPGLNDKIINSDLTKKLYNVVSEALISHNIAGDKKETEKFLDSLLSETRNLDKVKITIAFAPNDGVIEYLSKWAKANFSGNIIFDISVDPQILGGAIIANDKGEYADFSLSKKLTDLFLNQKEQILSLL